MLTPRFELGLTALFLQPSYFYEESPPLLPVDIISWRRCTIPYHVNILYYFNEHNLYREIDSNYRPCEYESHATNQLSYLGIKTTPTILEVELIMLLLCHSHLIMCDLPSDHIFLITISTSQIFNILSNQDSILVSNVQAASILI